MSEVKSASLWFDRAERAWDAPISLRVRAYVLPSIAFAVPVYFAQKFLQHLGGSALWYPRDWREVVAILGTSVGLAAFNWARIRDRHTKDPERGQNESRAARKLTRKSILRSRVEEKAQQVRSLAWYVAALALIVAYTFVRQRCVRTWEPRDAWLSIAGVLESGPEGLPSFIELAPHSRSAAAPSPDESVHATDSTAGATQHLASPSGITWRGTMLIPLWFSPETRLELDRRERERGIDGIQYCLQQDEDWLIDALTDREATGMSVTTLAFLLLHVGVLGCAAAGFGSSFTMSEELVQKLGELG